MPGLRRLAREGGWDLLAVDRRPATSAWYEALAAGDRPGRTVFGTPVAAIRETEAIAAVDADVPATAAPRQVLRLAVSIANLGSAAWPVAVSQPSRKHVVDLVARWRDLSAGGDATFTQAMRLSRDVAPGERQVHEVALAAPSAPGRYALEIRPGQLAGASFRAAGNRPLRREVEVVESPSSR